MGRDGGNNKFRKFRGLEKEAHKNTQAHRDICVRVCLWDRGETDTDECAKPRKMSGKQREVRVRDAVW